jgi:two-component system, cell cycle response regulator CtrA
MRILLVEDDPTTSRSIELMLTHANLNVYAPTSAKRGSTWRSSTTTT